MVRKCPKCNTEMVRKNRADAVSQALSTGNTLSLISSLMPTTERVIYVCPKCINAEKAR